MSLSRIEDVIKDAAIGKIFILVDDENRENEGDLCVLGEFASPDAINFMAKHGRGLICLSLTRSQSENLGLSLMERRNEGRFETAFTVSIEASKGVTTGISAADRSLTIKTAINQGYLLCIITGGREQNIKDRLEHLGVNKVFLNAHNKLPLLKQFIKEYRLLEESSSMDSYED